MDGLTGACHDLHNTSTTNIVLLHAPAIVVLVVVATIAIVKRRRAGSRSRRRHSSTLPTAVAQLDVPLLATGGGGDSVMPAKQQLLVAETMHDRSWAAISTRWHVALLVVFGVSTAATIGLHTIAPLGVDAELHAFDSAIRLVS